MGATGNLTQRANAGCGGSIPACQSPFATTRSPFERPPAGVRNTGTGHLDLFVPHSHRLAMSRGEPAPDEIGNHTNGEPVIEQSRSGAALLLLRQTIRVHDADAR